MSAPEIETLIRALSKLPGLGPRSGRRAALTLLQKRQQFLLPLIDALRKAADTVQICATCGNLDAQNPCTICSGDRRDPSLLCVVEQVADLWAMERAGIYKGLYHVLGGVLSALDGVTPDDLSIAPLVQRVANSNFQEVILALNATVDGQATAHYIMDRLESYPVKLSRLASGIPMGGELDYLDEGTLALALQARQTANS